MDSLYGKATNLDDFCKKAQLLNYNSYRAMFEGWQGRMFHNTTGVLLWMSHPAWPSTDWQTYSWDYETTGSYFGSMKACEPVHIQMENAGNTVSVINTTGEKWHNCEVLLQVYNLNGKCVYHTIVNNLAIGNDQTAIAFHPELSKIMPGAYLVRLQLLDGNQHILSQNDYWKCFGGCKNFNSLNQAGNARLAIRKISNKQYMVTNTSGVTAIAIKLNAIDRASKQIILPAYFSDGYFNLLPGESKTITAQFAHASSATVVADGYNIAH
jgi:hypothetical protein